MRASVSAERNLLHWQRLSLDSLPLPDPGVSRSRNGWRTSQEVCSATNKPSRPFSHLRTAPDRLNAEHPVAISIPTSGLIWRTLNPSRRFSFCDTWWTSPSLCPGLCWYTQAFAGQPQSSFAILSVCCFRPPLLGSSYPPCDSNTPRSARVPHRSGSLRQSWASAARAKPEPSANLGSVRANRHR